jgi:alanine or glycine:cation symporter, AGCS family
VFLEKDKIIKYLKALIQYLLPMKKRLFLFLTFFAPIFLAAQDVAKGLDEKINDWVKPATDLVANKIIFKSISIANVDVPIVVIYLLLAAAFFTVYFNFINVTGFGTALKTVRGKYDEIDHHEAADSKDTLVVDGDVKGTIKIEGKQGEVSHFQALTAALSGTVGLGNIAGVAIAISLGGPGATFWMIVAGLLGMSSKFVECTLGVKYRDVGPDGTVYGGPMYYLSKGLRLKGLGGLGKGLAAFFAVMCIGGSFGGGNMFQANQAAKQFNDMLGITSGYAGALFGIILAGLVAIVIIGGIKRIATVTEKVVPFMVGVYVTAALIIIGLNITALPQAFGLIFKGAFSAEGVTGGLIGVLIIGMKRAAFSNEAGVGSAAIAHSAVKTNYAASEGLVALMEPFIDTVIVCTMTSLVIIITQNYGDPGVMDGVALTSRAFATVLPWFPYVLTVAVVLFAFSTMLSWSYYGLQSWMYLFGKSKLSDYTYKILFCIFVVIGSAASLSAVTDFSDAMIFAMSIPNVIGLMILLPEVRNEVKKYYSSIKAFEGRKK